MTLNLTVVGPDGIHQSSDFRLTNADTGTVVSDASPKQVQLLYSAPRGGWRALLTYTGVGRWHGKDTCCWVTGWLKDQGGMLQFNDMVELIRSKGTSWLASMRRTMPHSFVIGAYVNGHPRVIVLSNFECLHCVNGQHHPDGTRCRDTIADGLRVTWCTPHSPIVIVTGQSPAVTRTYRQLLLTTARRERVPLRTRKVLAHVNAQAESLSNGMVSQGCITHSLMLDGTGEGEKFGDADGQYVPHILIHGRDMADAAAKVWAKLGRSAETMTYVGSTSGSSGGPT